MGKVWVLDTETKGTGARMVPLERTQKRPEPRDRIRVVRRTPPPPTELSDSRQAEPRRFKVVSVLTRQVLAEDADTRATVDLLRTVESPVEVRIHVWEPDEEAWRVLSAAERDALWSFRDR
jgi:hypothetical protein